MICQTNGVVPRSKEACLKCLILLMFTSGIWIYIYSRDSLTFPSISRTSHVKNIQYATKCDTTDQTLLSWNQLPLNTAKDFPRLLNKTQSTIFMHVAMKVTAILEKHRIQYIMTSGTLLGSYLVQGLLPWDDDFDVQIPHRGIKKILELTRKGIFATENLDVMLRKCTKIVDHEVRTLIHEDVTLKDAPSCPVGMIRVFLKDRRWTVRDTVWNWPFVDIEFGITWPGSDHKRPFAGHWLPAPPEPWQYLSTQFKSAKNLEFRCASKFFSHVSLQYQLEAPVTKDCKLLNSVYAFVHRDYHSAECVRENLVLGNTVLQSILVKENPARQQMGFGNFTWD